MKHRAESVGLLILWTAILSEGAGLGQGREDLRVWREFVAEIQAGKMEDPTRIRPYFPELLEPMKGYLSQLRVGIAWDKIEAEPKVYPVENRIHFVIALPYRGDDKTLSDPFCFTFVVEEGRWYFQHMETVMIPMDRLGPLPASSFPDAPAERKAWMREEIEISEQVRLFSYLLKDKGRDFAFGWFRDGAGYALAARTWVPFVSPHKALILYLCWDFANRRENPVTLVSLSDTEAVVRVVPRWFQMYERAAHLKPRISAEDYRRLFETIWTDRARQGNWTLSVGYEGDACVFRFNR